MARARKQPIPVTVIAGPTGAGKTTLINRLLEDASFANTAVILNDFGEIALQNALVEKTEDSYIALGSGCVCCSVRGGLTDGLEKLLRDLDNGRVAAISRVVIEADAAADPAAIVTAIARHQYLSLRFVADGIVAVLEAGTAAATLAARADTVRQVAEADVVALTRTAPAALRDVLRALNPLAEVVDAADARPQTFTGRGDFDTEKGDLTAWLAAARFGAANTADGEAGRVRAFAIERERSIPGVALDRFIDYLGYLQGRNLIRVRGAVATAPDETVIVEGIGGVFYPPVILDRPSGVVAATRFSVIARDLDSATFESYLDSFLNEARIDTPDRAALTENPLAIAGFSARSGR